MNGKLTVANFADFTKQFNGDIMSQLLEKKVEDTSYLVYCDYIAYLIADNLQDLDKKNMQMISNVGKMRYDLSEEGWFVSSKKTIQVESQGKTYKITVEVL